MDAFEYFDEHSADNVALAVRNNDIAMVEELLKSDRASLHLVDNRGYMPIHEASARGYLACLKLLLSHPCERDCINEKTHEGQTSAFLAAEAGHSHVLEYLAQESADLNKSNNEKETPLHAACKNGHPACVKTLLDYGAQINLQDDYKNSTPIHCACDGNRIECLKILLEQPNVNINAEDQHHATPLLLAFNHPDMEAMKMLLANGVDVTGKSSYYTPINVCIAHGSLEMIKLLLDAGADIDVSDTLNFGTIEAIIEREDPDIMKFVLENGIVDAESRPKESVVMEILLNMCTCIFDEMIGNYEQFYMALDVLLDYMKANVQDLWNHSFGNVVATVAGNNLVDILQRLYLKGFLHSNHIVHSNYNILEVAAKSRNPECLLYLLKLILKEDEDLIYSKAYICACVLLDENSNKPLQKGVALDSLSLLLRYVTPTNGGALIDLFLSWASHNPLFTDLLLSKYDIHEGEHVWALYQSIFWCCGKSTVAIAVFESPSSLKHKCRHIIRSTLGADIRLIRKDPNIPAAIADYLQFRHY